jgi:phytoene desaturase (3,4-didehydrolycopene-forming)
MKSKDGKTQDWPALVEQARRQVIKTMETRLGITGLREKIIWEEVNTPLTWKEKFNLAHGSILGITHDFFNVLSFRPQSRHPSIKNAYFVGASAHPGTGVSALHALSPCHHSLPPSLDRRELTIRSLSP